MIFFVLFAGIVRTREQKSSESEEKKSDAWHFQKLAAIISHWFHFDSAINTFLSVVRFIEIIHFFFFHLSLSIVCLFIFFSSSLWWFCWLMCTEYNLLIFRWVYISNKYNERVLILLLHFQCASFHFEFYSLSICKKKKKKKAIMIELGYSLLNIAWWMRLFGRPRCVPFFSALLVPS